eukprot:scaffold3299_cov116-Isochrysis_galbana.AAC.10
MVGVRPTFPHFGLPTSIAALSLHSCGYNRRHLDYGCGRRRMLTGGRPALAFCFGCGTPSLGCVRIKRGGIVISNDDHRLAAVRRRRHTPCPPLEAGAGHAEVVSWSVPRRLGEAHPQGGAVCRRLIRCEDKLSRSVQRQGGEGATVGLQVEAEWLDKNGHAVAVLRS